MIASLKRFPLEVHEQGGLDAAQLTQAGKKVACISCHACFSTPAMQEGLHCAIGKKE